MLKLHLIAFTLLTLGGTLDAANISSSSAESDTASLASEVSPAFELVRKPSSPAAISVKQQVNIGLVYQNYARSKVYDKAFKEIIRNINTGQAISSLRRVAARFTLVGVDCILPNGVISIAAVLDCLCNTMLKEQVSMIIFVTASENFDETTAASQYFLTMAATTGIPVIAWNADNSGYTFNKVQRFWEC